MIETVKEYANKRLELLKIEATEKSSISVGTMAYIALLTLAIAFFSLLLNIGIAVLLGKFLGNIALGFLIVAVFYLLIIILLVYNKKTIINKVANDVIVFLNRKIED